MAFDILCDFDGTISRVDVTDRLLERLADPAWQDVEMRWKRGEIGSRECMAEQVALIHASWRELCEVLDEVEIDPGFPAFLGAARRLGASVTVVSDGIDYAIRRILVRHGIVGLPIFANRLVSHGEGRFSLDHPHARPSCASGSGTCKCATAQSVSRGPAILIGDGRSDFCASAEVAFVLAKDALADHCAQMRIPHLAFRDFADLTPRLSEVADLMKRRAHPGVIVGAMEAA